MLDKPLPLSYNPSVSLCFYDLRGVLGHIKVRSRSPLRDPGKQDQLGRGKPAKRLTF